MIYSTFNKSHLSAFFILFFSFFLLTGCGRKEEPEEELQPQDDIEMPDTVITDTTGTDTTSLSKDKDTTPDVTGTWTGTFDQRATTLKINEQNGQDFKGVITINYREVINQTVSGSLDPKTSEMKMTDQVHSRFMGSYSGKLSEDGKRFSGTFTMKRDNSKFNFNLTKK